MDTSNWPDMPEQQRKRTLYVAEYLSTASEEKALHASGYRSRNTHRRIIEHIKTHGTLEEAPHMRATVKYTDSTLKAAMEWWIDNADQVFDTPALVAALEQASILNAPTDHHNFLQHLKQYAAQEGLTVLVGDRSTTFSITEETAAERLAWSKNMLRRLRHGMSLRNLIFTDEITLEESPHPKGGQLCISHTCLDGHTCDVCPEMLRTNLTADSHKVDHNYNANGWLLLVAAKHPTTHLAVVLQVRRHPCLT